MLDDLCVEGEAIEYKCKKDSMIIMETPEAIK